MRAFLAIDFNSETKDTLINQINVLKSVNPELKWIKRQSLHVTLKFLGEITAEQTSNIIFVLKNRLNKTKCFKLETTKPGFFPNRKEPRVYFLSLSDSPNLQSIFVNIQNDMANLGFKKETRKFHPHITLARIKDTIPTIKEIKSLLEFNFSKIIIKVNEIVLMQSELLPSGARYTPVQKFYCEPS